MGLQNCPCQAAKTWRAGRTWLDSAQRWTVAADARVYHPEDGEEYISQAHMKTFVVDAASLSWEGWDGGTLDMLLDDAEEYNGTTVYLGAWKDSELASWVPAFSCIA